MAHSWLQRQRKQALLDLSKEAGLNQDDDLRKDEIVEALEEHLQANATRLSKNATFEGYYGTKRATPAKARESTAAFLPSADEVVEEVKSIVKPRGRRPTKVKQESEDDSGALSSPVAAVSNALSSVTSALSPSTQLQTRTPAAATRASGRRRSELPGPPSPAVVADIVEEESTRFVAWFNDLYNTAGVAGHIANLRELLSSVTSIQLTFLFIEAFALQTTLMPWKYAFDFPAIPTLGISSFGVPLPDMFILLTGFYWSSTLLFATTNILVPWVVAYFYNLTIRDVKRGTGRVAVARYAADPLTFNVVKGLLAWLVYGQGVSFGFINGQTAERVELALYGGYRGTLITSGIGALAALYEAAQKRPVQ